MHNPNTQLKPNHPPGTKVVGKVGLPVGVREGLLVVEVGVTVGVPDGDCVVAVGVAEGELVG